MNRATDETVGTGPITVYCPSCGGSMRVAPAHVNTLVACPHCEGTVEPWHALHAGVPSPPPPPVQGAYQRPYGPANAAFDGYSWRNRWIAGALAVLLGYFGIHRFYMGNTGIGLIQVLLTVCTFGALAPVVYIWACIEGLLCFCGAMRDVDGLPLRG